MRKISEVIDRQDIGYMHSFAKELSMIGCTGGEKGFRTSGSSGEYKTIKRIEKEMRKIGLKNVSIEEYDADSWEFLSGRLELVNENIVFAVSSYGGINGTPEGGIAGEIVDVGKGRACDYEGLEVKGKLVLCSIDLIEDYWVNVPAMQARARGAIGILISYRGDRYSKNENALGSFDSQASSDFPIANISRKTASTIRELISSKKEKIRAKLTLNMFLDCEKGKSHNVVGYIPGEYSDRYIMLGAHLDGYFNAYQDDAIGLGIHMSIAKAIIESGYKTKHTLIFIAHGSEEYGAANSRYDWCIGSYNSIRKIHPDWFGKIDIFLNFDAFRPDALKLIINGPDEYKKILQNCIEKLSVPDNIWPKGISVAGMHGPWSDDYNYAICGVPGLICGKDLSEWSSMNYHTQFDDYTIFGEEKEKVKYIAMLYSELIHTFDSLVLPPFDFSTVMEKFKGSLHNLEKYCGTEAERLCIKISEVEKDSKKVYAKICRINYEKAHNIQYDEVRILLFDIYRIIQHDLIKLDVTENMIFAHEAVAENCKYFAEIIKALKNKSKDSALENLSKIDLNRFAIDFDKEVFSSMMNWTMPNYEKLFWGEGKLHNLYDGYQLFQNIKFAEREEEFYKAANEAEKALYAEIMKLRGIMKTEYSILEKIHENMLTFHKL